MLLTKEKPLPAASVYEIFIRNAQHFHDTGKLFLFILTRKDRITSIKLGENTPKAPHVNCHVVIHTEEDFRRTIKATLNVLIN